jgi:hypothetical protein
MGTNVSKESAASILKVEEMETADSFENLYSIYQTTWRHIPGDHILDHSNEPFGCHKIGLIS